MRDLKYVIGLALYCLAAPALAQDPLPPWEERHIRLDDPVDDLKFIGNGRLLLIGNDFGRIQLLDVESGEIESEIVYAEAFGRAAITDVAFARQLGVVYLVGESVEEDNAGLLIRVQLETGDTKTIRFKDQFILPSVAASVIAEEGRIFVGDLNSSTITVVEDWMFEKLSDVYIDRSELPRNIYLKEGPAIDLEVLNDGRFLVVSHGPYAVVSLIDTEYAEQTDRLTFGKGATFPVEIRVAAAPNTFKSGARFLVILAELGTDVLMLLAVDPGFQSFNPVERVPIGLSANSGPDLPLRTLLLAAAENMSSIIVGSRSESRVVVFSHEGDALLGRYAVTLGEPPRAIDLSPDGQTAAILSGGRSLTLISDPLAWAASQAGGSERSERVAEAQRNLARMGYPVGVVDGIYGFKTKTSVKEFQRNADFQPTGIIDERTFAKLSAIAAEVAPRGVCEPVPTETRCPRNTKLSIVSRSDDRQFEEWTCAAPNRPERAIQIDRFRVAELQSSKKDAEATNLKRSLVTRTTEQEDARYSCTMFNSCAGIPFTKTLAYVRFCRSP